MEDRPFWQVIQRIEQGRFKGKQVDWGAWEAKVSKRAIEQFVDDLYSGYDWYAPGSAMPHLLESYEELKGFVENLEPGRQYTLIASEL